jgi:hypothetical protein
MHGLSFRHLSHIAHIMIYCAAYHEMWAEVKAEIRSTLLQVVLTMMIITERAGHLPPFLTEDATRQVIGADRYAPDGPESSPCPAKLAAQVVR